MTRIQREVARRRLGPGADVYVGTPIGELRRSLDRVATQRGPAAGKLEGQRALPDQPGDADAWGSSPIAVDMVFVVKRFRKLD
jgi:hypothetical protein